MSSPKYNIARYDCRVHREVGLEQDQVGVHSGSDGTFSIAETQQASRVLSYGLDRDISRATRKGDESLEQLAQPQSSAYQGTVVVSGGSIFGFVFDAIVDKLAVAKTDGLHAVGDGNTALRAERFKSEPQNSRVDVNTVADKLSGNMFCLEYCHQRARRAMVAGHHGVEQMCHVREPSVEAGKSLLVRGGRVSERGDYP